MTSMRCELGVNATDRRDVLAMFEILSDCYARTDRRVAVHDRFHHRDALDDNQEP